MDKPRRRWFRYSLRTLFVLLTVFGVWLGYHANWMRQRREARKWIDDHVVFAWFGYEIQSKEDGLPLGLRILGEGAMTSIVQLDASKNVDERDVVRIEGLFPESKVVLVRPAGTAKSSH